MGLLYGTTYVLDHEPCFGLMETIRQSPDSSGFHRYQIIKVIRDDKVVEFEQDLGLSSEIRADPFLIPGGIKEGNKGEILHNVGELRKIAEQLKGKKLWDKKELAQNNQIREKY